MEVCIYLAEKNAMKTFKFIFLLAALTAVSCNYLMMSDPVADKGTICVRFEGNSFPGTRASEIPDTNDFILSVKDSKGKLIYGGSYGAAPQEILADPGTYTVSVESCEFGEPQFDCPQYGDTEIVVVKAGAASSVTLYCSQLNCGIRLKTDPEFLTAYPSGVLFVKASTGKLMYAYSERRFAYFLPGNISLVLSDTGGEKTLFTKTLSAQDMLSLGVTVSSSMTGGMAVQVDTTRHWLSDDVEIGGTGGGSDTGNAFSVGSAHDHVGESDVWVYGYIVGGDLSSSKCSFSAPFSSRTNIVLASKSSCRDKASCLSVQLSKGDIRDALNLVDHPELLGRQIYLKGEIVGSYYGITGIQNLSEYEFK